MTSGQIVRNFREIRGLSIRGLADASGVKEQTIRRIEGGQAPKLPDLVALLDALEVDATTRLALVGG